MPYSLQKKFCRKERIDKRGGLQPNAMSQQTRGADMSEPPSLDALEAEAACRRCPT